VFFDWCDPATYPAALDGVSGACLIIGSVAVPVVA
jgi:hypothetical protein